MTQLPTAPPQYNQTDQAQLRRLIQQELSACFQAGGTVEIGAGRFILKDDVTGTRYMVTIHNGAIAWAATTL